MMDGGGWFNPVDLIKIGMMQSMDVSLMELPDLIGPILNTEPEGLSARRAIVWGRNDLLAHAVGSFLKSRNWDVAHVSGGQDAEVLLLETKRIHPEVVILCREEADESVLAFRLIDEQTCPRVITLGLDSNLMQVYSKQNIHLQGASDLLAILDHGIFSDCRPGKEARGEE
jgi:hypothetical protein